MQTSDKPSPAFYSVFANADGRTVSLPQYSGWTENIVLDKVLEAAEREGYKGTGADRIKELGWWVGPVYAEPLAPTPSAPRITEREESLIQMLRSECAHAARNNMRLPPTLEHRNGRLAVPEEYIDAVIEGWHREHGIPFLRAAPQDQPPTTA